MHPRRILFSAAVLWVVAACASDDPVETSAGGSGHGGDGDVGGSGAGTSSGRGGHGGEGGSSTSRCDVVVPDADPFAVATDSGVVRGAQDGVILAFRGIPYAAPPVGDLRFRAPREHACWDGLRDATQYGNACVQILPSGSEIGSEDCLVLNVFTPSTTDGPKPVLFWVHGGALLLGSGSQDLVFDGTGNLYDGKKLAEEQDVVVVSVNYRLAQLGFLAHPALSAEDEHGSSGNYGMLDQIAALEWVQRNIENFGGDPSRVMLFGESAGGLSTCLLVSSPLAAGLFSSAMVESGGCIVATRARRFAQGEGLASDVGCAGAQDVAACLRDQPSSDFVIPPPVGVASFVFEDLLRAWEMPFGPNQDGYVFAEPPLTAIREGRHNAVPIGIGSNAEEFALFVPPGTINFCTDYWSLILALFGDLSDEVLAQYSCFDYAFPRDAAVAVGTDFLFTCPARRMARAARQGGSAPVHRYYFPHRYTGSVYTALDAFHTAELPFLFQTFGVLGYDPTPEDLDVSGAMGGYWSSLARTGSPNAGASFTWPVYDASEVSLVIDEQLGTIQGLASGHCDFWDSLATD